MERLVYADNARLQRWIELRGRQWSRGFSMNMETLAALRIFAEAQKGAGRREGDDCGLYRSPSGGDFFYFWRDGER